mmetsp:Transcript_6412/g.18995  ORF Transcript_6412/g.18995 Transcript_6412/m.18995 type:complete len:349 (-) Transcript_6412:351-1397(-)
MHTRTPAPWLRHIPRPSPPPRRLVLGGGLGARRVGVRLVGRLIDEDRLEPKDDVLRRLLARLALRLQPLLVLGRRRLGLLEHLLALLEHVSRLGLERLGRQGDAPLGLVLGDDHALDRRAERQHRRDVRDVVARDLRDVQQARHAPQVDEGAVGLDGGHDAGEDGADVEVVDRLVDHRLAVRHHQPVVFAVDVEELDLERLPDELLGRVLAGQVVRAGQEGAQPLHRHYRPAAVHGGDGALDGLVRGHHLRDLVPRLDSQDLPAREQLLPVLVLARHDQELIRRAEVKDVLGAHGLLEGGLADGAVGGGLDADVNQHAVGLEPEHRPRHRVAPREGGDVAHARLEVRV